MSHRQLSRVRLRPFLLLVFSLLLVLAAAYIQWGTVGLPALPLSRALTPAIAAEPYGFPAWLRITHYVNFLFLVLLIRQRPANPRGPSPAVLEPSLHPRHRVAPAHAGGGT